MFFLESSDNQLAYVVYQTKESLNTIFMQPIYRSLPETTLPVS